MIDPEMQLSHIERGHLYALATSEGWRILQNLMEAECAKFDVALKNVRAGDTAALIESHAIAKAASAFVVGIINRLNDEMAMYHSEQSMKKPVDPTEDSIDLGDFAKEDDGSVI